MVATYHTAGVTGEVRHGTPDGPPDVRMLGGYFLFASPDAGAEHLRALAAVSRALRGAELRERLRQARTPDAIHALFVRDTEKTAA